MKNTMAILGWIYSRTFFSTSRSNNYTGTAHSVHAQNLSSCFDRGPVNFLHFPFDDRLRQITNVEGSGDKKALFPFPKERETGNPLYFPMENGTQTIEYGSPALQTAVFLVQMMQKKKK